MRKRKSLYVVLIVLSIITVLLFCSVSCAEESQELEIQIYGSNGGIRDYCKYVVYRNVGRIRQYYSMRSNEKWVEDINSADAFEADSNGILRINPLLLPDGEYWLEEIVASWGQDLLSAPVPFYVNNQINYVGPEEQNDFSWLDDLTINQLKQLDKEIHKRIPYDDSMNSSNLDLSYLNSASSNTYIKITNSMNMEPTLQPGDYAVITPTNRIEQGDIIAFFFNDKILLRRAIALAGDRIMIDDEGYVYVNSRVLEEPYISEHAVGQCDNFRTIVGNDEFFVLGDNREYALDSRARNFGCVHLEDIIGKMVMRIVYGSQN